MICLHRRLAGVGVCPLQSFGWTKWLGAWLPCGLQLWRSKGCHMVGSRSGGEHCLINRQGLKSWLGREWVGGLKLRWGELSGNRVDRGWWVSQGLMGRTRANGWDKGWWVGQAVVGATRAGPKDKGWQGGQEDKTGTWGQRLVGGQSLVLVGRTWAGGQDKDWWVGDGILYSIGRVRAAGYDEDR